jgi:methionine aminopeptidase
MRRLRELDDQAKESLAKALKTVRPGARAQRV